MTDQTQKKAHVRLPMSAADALELVMNGRHSDCAALAKIGDVISGKAVESNPQPDKSISSTQD